MIIRKGNKEYTITERRECWVLSCKIGGLSVEYKVRRIFAPMKRNCAPTFKRKNCFRGEKDGGEKENENFVGGEEPI